MKKKITPQMAHDEIVASIGKYGFYTMNNYLELRNVILFGVRDNGYVPDIDKMLAGKVIDKALEMLDGDLIVSIRPVNLSYGSKCCDAWELNILPMLSGGCVGCVDGEDFTVMNQARSTLDECLAEIEKRKANIFDKVFGTTSKLYVTGHKDAVDKAAARLEQIRMEIEEYYEPHEQPIPPELLEERQRLMEEEERKAAANVSASA